MPGDQKKYFEPLNGFRGLAVIFILIYHSHYDCFNVLWIGVPMFFVLSGFLITRILLENKNSENYFKAFYTRRSLRIFPVYYLTLLISVLWGLRSHTDLSQLPLYIFYLQNFVIAHDIQPEFCAGVLRHTWSLSVEEIFYLLWPLIVYFFNTKNLFRLILILGIGTIVFKLLYVVFLYKPNEEPVLMLSLIGSTDSLMAGSLLGFLSLNSNSFIQKKFPLKFSLLILFFFSLSVFLNYFFIFNSHCSYLLKIILSSLTVLISFLTIARLAFYTKSQSPIYKRLTGKGLLFAGKISYGIYLYHNIIYRAVDSLIYQNKLHLPQLLIFVIEVCLTLIIAALSWHFIEKPFLKLKDKISYSGGSARFAEVQ